MEKKKEKKDGVLVLIGLGMETGKLGKLSKEPSHHITRVAYNAASPR